MMNDVYVECLISAKKSTMSKAMSVVLIILAAFFFLFAFFLPASMILAIIAGVGAYFVKMYSCVEYEYLYVDKELSVDKILAQSKRKRVADYSIDRMEIFAPINSWHLDNFKNRNVKTIDYSIGKELQPDLRYAMYYEGGVRVLFSPSEEMVKTLKNVAPRKVFSD